MKSSETLYDELIDDLPVFIYLYMRIKKERPNKERITDLLENETRLIESDKRDGMWYDDFIKELQLQKLYTKQEINQLRTRRGNYEGISIL